MKYVSTRGEAPALDFADVLLRGLAADGGLYVPEEWPRWEPSQFASLAGLPYADAARRVMLPFVDGAIEEERLAEILDGAYETFHHPAIAPLVQLDPGLFVLELFHGPTLAFKDVAMQVLGRLMDHVLAERGRRATIVGATSGDTGGAAIEAFRGSERVDIFILYPHGRVSDVQRRQMTTPEEANVHAIAIDGNFDDCQTIVKGLFADHAFRERTALSAVNSINWARILAQVVYYVTSAVALGAPHRPVSFSVPTGNFGDVFAGYVAHRMGLPTDRLVVATNVNDILVRALDEGRYEVRGVVATQSPSMDIQISSNFERLLFEASGRDHAFIRQAMSSLKQSGAFTIGEAVLGRIGEKFSAVRVDEQACADTMARLHREAGYLPDPHTAIGIAAGAEAVASSEAPMVALATAHPAKFPDAVENATGVRPALPVWATDLAEKPERFEPMPADQRAVADHILSHARSTAFEVS
ncbi:threonine synthase [Lutibaculum baratangense]|uniref:Threonine synthase n=1 Tax=Lutibaculum baratangense AMV1 TaxID=631454 RepID=V4QYX8_9HYPH|nr:threonine synthase [Lutibaculum baratangense]ESR24932.1 Threonine synthase [Lutibaculum baratangense AMV1]